MALRTAVCIAGPAFVGWPVGDLSAGLLASLGGFASLYGSDRPFRNRARLLLVIAAAQALAVAVGIWADALPWAEVLAVTGIAVGATVACLAFNVQPGAYQIALSCATGTAMHTQGADPLQSGLIVLAGGLFGIVIHLSGALVDRHGPERGAVSAAARAVADFIDGIQAEEANELQHRAAVVMHHAWVVLVNQPQPAAAPVGRHAGSSGGPGRGHPGPEVGDAASHGLPVNGRQLLTSLPLGRPSAFSMVGNTVAPGSRTLPVVIRVAVAAAAAGTIGAALGLSHTYWAIAAAVLILGPGFDQRRTVQRGLERTAGTFVGLALAALALAAPPQAWCWWG